MRHNAGNDTTLSDESRESYDPFVEHPIPTSIGLFTLAITIVLLNLIAIIVFVKRRRSKPPVDYPLLSLLVANVLQGAMTLPAYALKKINAFGYDEQAIICDVYRFSFFVCAHASIMSLLVSNVDRLIALTWSLRYHEIVTRFRIYVVLFATWLFVIAFDVIPLFSKRRNSLCHYVPTKTWSVSMHVVMNVIPLPLLLAGYIFTIRIAYKHAQKTRSSLRSNQLSRKDRVRLFCGIRATKKVTMIIGSYFICVGPACVYYLLEWLCASCYSIEYKLYHEQYAHFFLKLLVNIYAIVSAVIFYWNSKDFRSTVKKVLSGRDPANNSIEFGNSVTGDRSYFINKKSHCSDENYDTQSDCSSTKEGKRRNDIPLNGNLKAVLSDNGNGENGVLTNGNEYQGESLSRRIFKRNLIGKSKEEKEQNGMLLPAES